MSPLLNSRWSLHDIVDVEAFAISVASRGRTLSPSDFEELVTYLVETAWELSRTFDPARGSFVAFLRVRLPQRRVDWQRSRFRTKWQFKERVYERKRPELVSLDGPSEIPWNELSPRTAAILRTVATSASQGWSTSEIASGHGISTSSVSRLIDEARAEIMRLSQ